MPGKPLESEASLLVLFCHSHVKNFLLAEKERGGRATYLLLSSANFRMLVISVGLDVNKGRVVFSEWQNC